MLPKVIIHNSVSLDGSLVDFEPDMGLHYDIAGGFKPQAHLVGSSTVRVGSWFRICSLGSEAFY
jgi:2,5-diamino-6-(ribosylamino)-4(3H)-pyrimidinone 5'-phosphate reductase